MQENNNNNAVEKVENITHKNRKKHPKTVNVMKKSEQKARKKAEHERVMAERRIELARIRAHKKAEREKVKAAALREKNRKKAELKLKKQEIKKEKAMRKAERKAQKSYQRDRRKKDRRGYGGWLAAVITLSVATLVLASVLTFTFLMPTTADSMLENTYRMSYYDTVKQVDNIDVNLSKILASSDKGAMQKYLVDTAINSELAESDIQKLPLQDESKFYTTKLVNQIGDFAKYLNNKIVDGKPLTDSDMEMLNRLYQANLNFKNALLQMTEQMGNDYSFSTVLNGGSGNLVINGFNQLENLSVDYPELIYDGPFSDGQDQREIKGLTGEEISEDSAKQIFSKIFASYNLENVANVGSTSGIIECFNVQGEKDGEILYAQISKKGGKLIMFAFSGSCNQTAISSDDATKTAQEFLRDLGIDNMKAVWLNLTGNVYTINFASTLNHVIIYPDLIKVRVCAETNTVIGIESTSYYTNHTERVISSPTLSKTQAKSKVSDNIEIETSRLALVPLGTSSEVLCYEFSGTFDGSTYYVYIDATTGKQVEMFKVVVGTEGSLLI